MTLGFLGILALLLLAQAAVTAAAIFLGELVVEDRLAEAGEWVLSLALAAGALLVGLARDVPPIPALAAALAFSAAQFLVGLGVARAGSAVADMGTTWGGLGPRYPIAAACALGAIFPPTGLGRAMGAPDLYEGLALHYWIGLGAGGLVLALFHWLDDEGTSWILRWILTLALVAAASAFAMHGRAERSRAALAMLVLASALAAESVAVLLLVEPEAVLDKERLAREGRLLLATWGAVLAVWILPLFAGS